MERWDNDVNRVHFEVRKRKTIDQTLKQGLLREGRYFFTLQVNILDYYIGYVKHSAYFENVVVDMHMLGARMYDLRKSIQYIFSFRF